VPQLQQVRWHVQGEASWLKDVHREMENVLRQRFQRGATTTSEGLPDEYGASFWHDVRQWRSEEEEVFLYRYVDTANRLPDELRVLVRNPRLLDVLARDVRLASALALRNPLEERFVAEATKQFPSVGELLVAVETPANEAQVIAVARRMLAELASARPEVKPLAMLVLNRVAEQIEYALEPGDKSGMDPVLKERLDLQWDEQNGGWWYPGTLRRAVWVEYPDTIWGEYAFFDLLLSGFGSHGIFDQADAAAVVEQGTAYLRTRANSPYRQVVLVAIAQASETLWSLSIAPREDVCVDDSREGSEQKRLAAIAVYEALALSTEGKDPINQIARRQIARLQAGYDTGARYFFDCYP
jgi:hypothetical protein